MRLFIVSNRLPFTLKEEKGKVQFLESSGGLVTGLSAYLDSLRGSPFTKLEYIWVGWPGISITQKLENDVRRRALQEFHASPVFMEEKAMDSFYHGFCNRTIWPLFHSFPVYASHEEHYWDSYGEVNEVFCREILKILEPDDVLWIHDYHLMLLPALIRQEMPGMSIGFFLHIPFPPYEIYRLLHKAWRVRILEGLLGSDLIGFHTHDYAQYFLRCVLRILGYEHNIGQIPVNDRIVKADTFPMGIHYDKYHGSISDPQVQAEKEALKRQFEPLKLVLSVDRLDYTKGIVNRLQGYELFLERNPQWRKKISLLLIVVPSRIGVPNYQRMKKQIDEMVGRINGRYSDIGWVPIVYQFKHLPFPQLIALYNSCDIALITPLRDGMNLVAKEYVAARSDATGVIILSEMAGSAKELGEALIINPYHRQEIADALREALEMPCEEQRRRLEAMQNRLKGYDVIHWVDDFLRSLSDVTKQKRDLEAKLLPAAERKAIIREFKTAAAKILFLDYDGTLVPFVGQPERAQPDANLLQTVEALARCPGTDVVLISGRDRHTLEQWFGALNVTLVAEHGVWTREKGAEWQLLKPVTSEWKAQLMPVIQRYVERLPGSFMEEKGFSIVWHFRNAEPELASVRAKELMDDLITFAANTDVQVLHGSKVIEVRNAGVNKGVAGTHFLSRREYDLILAVGDDWTDEDLFRVIPQRQNNYTLKVGITPSNACYNLKDYKETRKLLEDMIR